MPSAWAWLRARVGEPRVRRMDLDYQSTLSRQTIDALEEAARSVGLPLREVELIGQDPEVARGFVDSVRQGRHVDYLKEIDWTRLERRLRRGEVAEPAVTPGPDPTPA